MVVADLFGTELHSGCIAATPDVIFELDMIFELVILAIAFDGEVEQSP